MSVDIMMENEHMMMGHIVMEQLHPFMINPKQNNSINSLQRNNDIMQKQTVDEQGFVIGIDDPNYQQLMFEVDYNVADTELMDWMDPKLSHI